MPSTTAPPVPQPRLRFLAEFLEEVRVLRQSVDNRDGLAAAARLFHPELCHHPRRHRLVGLLAAAAAVGRRPPAPRTDPALVAGINDSRVVTRPPFRNDLTPCPEAGGSVPDRSRRLRRGAVVDSDDAGGKLARERPRRASETRIAWPRPASSSKQAAEVGAAFGIERCGWFVHHQQRRIERQRARDGDPLRLAAGQLTRQRTGPVVDAERTEQVPRACLRCRRARCDGRGRARAPRCRAPSGARTGDGTGTPAPCGCATAAAGRRSSGPAGDGQAFERDARPRRTARAPQSPAAGGLAGPGRPHER